MIKRENGSRYCWQHGGRRQLPQIKLLTYNLSWESWTGRKSGWPLCNLESGHHPKQCRLNILSAIDQDGDYDLIALQEVADLEAVISGSRNLRKMNYLAHQSGLNQIALFFQGRKVVRKMGSEFVPGRPFQVVLFDDGLLVVHLHAGHRSQGFYSLGIKVLERTIPQAWLSKAKRVLLVGDFNLDPLRIGVKKILGRQMTGSKDKVLSCCSTNQSRTGDRYPSDTVLISSPAKVKLKALASKYPASDHRPVVALITKK